ncbi:MAG: hypothetical protein R3Y53_03915 [Bacillota bacterium]
MGMIMSIFTRAMKSVTTIYTVKLSSKLNVLKTIPTRLAKVVKKQIQRMISFLFGKPTSLQEYYKIEDWYISKRLVLKTTFVIVLVGVFSTIYLYPYLEGKLWYAKLTVNTNKFHEFNGKALVYDTEGDLLYQGVLEKGLPNGVGEVYEKDKLAYQGDLVRNVRTGTGKEYENGTLIYEGGYDQNLYEGEGTKYFPLDTKQIYQTGTFVAGELQEGTEYFENGDKKYTGTLEKGLKSGSGTLYENDAVLYTGAFAKDLKNGMGTLYENGQILYRGNFVDDVYQGAGELYQNGELLYKGDFQGDSYHGNGELYENGDLIYMGDFVNNTYQGNGELYDHGRVLYMGGFTNNLRQGEGIAYEETTGKKVYEGSFQNDLYDGFGTLYDSKTGRTLYTGEFANGLYEGSGTLYTNSGQQLFAGLFFQGNIDYIQFCNAEETTVKEAFGNEDAIEMFPYSYFTVYQNADVVFEYHFSVDGQAPRVSNMKLLGDQEIQGVKVGMSMTEVEKLLGDDEFYSVYPFMIEENEQYILRMLNTSGSVGDTLYTAKYNFDDYYIRCYANSANGEVLYYEVGGN